jgi:hypothetical protein
VPSKDQQGNKGTKASSKKLVEQANAQTEKVQEEGPKLPIQYTFMKGYYKVAAKRKKSKQSMGSCSVPLPSCKDSLVSKPASSLVNS